MRYYPEDEGNGALSALRESSSILFDAKRRVVLFDGLRAHSVTSFNGDRGKIRLAFLLFRRKTNRSIRAWPGERYSLVYFTAPDFAGSADQFFLQNIGAIWPTNENHRYYLGLICPPRGGTKSIVAMFGSQRCSVRS